MRKICYLVLAILFHCSVVYSQAATKLTEEEPVEIDGIQYGYNIKNEGTKEAGGKEMSRYEITLYATNKSSCLKLFLFERRNAFSNVATAVDDLAKFDCKNANIPTVNIKKWQCKSQSFL
jgi:hypothetical protein